MISRCNPTERKIFERRGRQGTEGAQHGEPAMGTLDERLDIIIRRLGGQTQIRLTKQERLLRELARES